MLPMAAAARSSPEHSRASIPTVFDVRPHHQRASYMPLQVPVLMVSAAVHAWLWLDDECRRRAAMVRALKRRALTGNPAAAHQYAAAHDWLWLDDECRSLKPEMSRAVLSLLFLSSAATAP